MSAKVFKSVVHNGALPKRVNDFVPVEAKRSAPAEKASPRFVDIFEQAQKTFASKKVFRSILTFEKPAAKKA